MKKTFTAITVAVLLLALSAGAAFALTQVCDTATCVGTGARDVLTGTAIDNTISGKGKGDTINDTEGQDRDTIFGGKGNDKINVREGNNSSHNNDFVNCGPGTDTVIMDSNDVAVGCER